MEIQKLDSTGSLEDEELKRQIAHEEEMYQKAKESRELLEQKMKKLEMERQQLLERIGSSEIPESHLPVTQKSSVGEEVEIATAQRTVVETNMSKPKAAEQEKEEEAKDAGEEKGKDEEEEDEGIINKVVSFVSSYFNWE